MDKKIFTIFHSKTSLILTVLFLFYRRNQNYRDIIKGLTMSLGQKHLGNFDITNQFHHVFWLGDLNYRVQEDIQVRISDNQFLGRLIFHSH